MRGSPTHTAISSVEVVEWMAFFQLRAEMQKEEAEG